MNNVMDNQMAARMARLCHVPRWTVIPLIQKQSVAEHVFNCMWIYTWLCYRYKIKVTGGAMIHMLVHDHEEALSGDIPGPWKHKALIEDKEHNMNERIVKYVNVLEEYRFLIDQQRLGHTGINSVVDSVVRRVMHFGKSIKGVDWEKDMKDLFDIGVGSHPLVEEMTNDL